MERKRRKISVLEKVQDLENKRKRTKEEKEKITLKEEELYQEKALKLKEIYDFIFQSLEIPVEEIIYTSKNNEEIIYRIKEILEFRNDERAE